MMRLHVHSHDVRFDLVEEETIEEVLLELPTAAKWRLTIGRKRGSEWVRLELEIARRA